MYIAVRIEMGQAVRYCMCLDKDEMSEWPV